MKRKRFWTLFHLFSLLPSTLSLFTCLSLVFSLQHQCLQGVVCPISAASTAYCGACDLDPSMTTCTWVLSAHTHPDTPYTTHPPFLNTTHETLTTGLSTPTNRSENTYKMADTYSYTHTENLQFEGALCPSHEEVMYSGDANRYTYTGMSTFSGKTDWYLEELLFDLPSPVYLFNDLSLKKTY